MNSSVSYFLFFAAILATLLSCDSNKMFDQYQRINESAWHKDSLLIFHIPVTDTLHNHNLLIQVRNEITYKYSNLWLFIEITQPGDEGLRDTFEILLTEPSGRSLGKGIGGVKTVETVYRQNIYFPVSGKYSISLQHGMREELLEGIHDVGIRIERTTSRE